MDTSSIVSNELLERIIVDHSQLLLDNKNPRFYGEKIDRYFINTLEIENPKLQEHLRQTIYNKYNIQDLISSIIEVGFLRIDPIMVVESGNYYRVIEGNRRLSAIKTIHGEIKKKNLSVESNIYKSLCEIEVVNIKDGYDESTIWMLQGIRHVSGIRDWGPFQQAELIKTLYNSKKMSYKQIGSIIGLSPARVSTILKAYYGVIQMMKDKQWMNYATPNLFSHFEQAYVRAPVREWLGWDRELFVFTNNENRELFYKWIVHDDPKIPREKMKSRDIRDKLPYVLEHPEAKNLMVSDEVSIDEAFSIVQNGCRSSQEIINTSERLSKYLEKIKSSSRLSSHDKAILSKLKLQISELIR